MVYMVDSYESFQLFKFELCTICTNLFDGRIRKKIENTKTATWLLLCSPTNKQQLKEVCYQTQRRSSET